MNLAALKYLTIIYFFILVFFSCNQNKNPLIRFCTKVENRIPKDTLIKFTKRLENDSAHLSYYQMFKEAILEELEDEKDLESVFNASGINNKHDKAFTIFVAMHRKLNNKEIYFDSLLNETRTRRIESDKRQKRIDECNKERIRIATINYNKIEKGDLIKLSYPFEIVENNYKNAFLYDCPNAYSKNEDEYVYLTGTVLNKDESLNVEMIVTGISDESVRILMKGNRKDGIHYVDLESYGREIIKLKK